MASESRTAVTWTVVTQTVAAPTVTAWIAGTQTMAKRAMETLVVLSADAMD